MQQRGDLLGHDIHALSLDSRHRNDRVEIEYRRVRHYALGDLLTVDGVGLVYREDDRRSLFFQTLEYGSLDVRNRLRGVDHKYCRVDLADGRAYRLDHEIAELVLRLQHTGRVHEDELILALGEDTGYAVSGRLRLLRGYRDLLAEKRVEERRFSDVRTSHYCNESCSCHFIF